MTKLTSGDFEFFKELCSDVPFKAFPIVRIAFDTDLDEMSIALGLKGYISFVLSNGDLLTEGHLAYLEFSETNEFDIEDYLKNKEDFIKNEFEKLNDLKDKKLIEIGEFRKKRRILLRLEEDMDSDFSLMACTNVEKVLKEKGLI